MASLHAEVANDVDIEVSHEIIDRIERKLQKSLVCFWSFIWIRLR